MKRKVINENKEVNGLYIADFIRGFMGRGEGQRMLESMGVPSDKPPFSVAMLLQTGKAKWRDSEGKTISIKFTLKPGQLECYGYYRGNKKQIRMFREWGDCDCPSMVKRLESEAIGDLCMKCIYEKLFN